MGVQILTMSLHVLMVCVWFLLQPSPTLTQANNASFHGNVDCAPYVYYVHTSNGTYQHRPYIVQIHRCHGKTAKYQTLTSCVPSQTENVNLVVIPQDPSEGLYKIITMVNHTKCVDVCYHTNASCNQYSLWDTQTCKCHCRYSSTPSDCVAPFTWDQSYCDCRCPYTKHTYPCNNKRQEFSRDACGCVCASNWTEHCRDENKYLDPSTCACVDKALLISESTNPNCLDTKGKVIMAVILLAEAIAILAIFYLYNQYSKLLKIWCCSENASMKFQDDISSDKIDGGESNETTPTMEFSTKDNENPEAQEKLLYRNDSQSSYRPFVFQDSLSRRNKYRYEMGNIVPVISWTTPIKGENGTTYYHDVDNVSDSPTFNLTDSLASVTRV